ncbi:hypothetical protein [Amycolatopsis jejuensis]|uniref:hypothetical protein n=1 Tax=Amycolatopsis jejuensis TaxID=330084 RepID=UPI000526E8BE|nr:hypothetical protein [Amycolatopsis jejuensis]
MRRHLAGLAVVAVLVTGCGVRPSGVISGEEAPSGPPVASSPGTPSGTPGTSRSLYFVHGGAVVPVSRFEDTESVGELVRLLAQGPTADERLNGYTSEVPSALAPIVVSTDDAATLGVDVRTLTPNAVAQIVCTMLAAGSRVNTGTVTLTGGGQSLGPRGCTT